MGEADDQFLERLEVEVEPLLRGWARLGDLRLDRRSEGVRIVAALETTAGTTEVECVGSTLIEAAARVPGRLGETRLELAFRDLVLADGS
jgi:hypothetical protein